MSVKDKHLEVTCSLLNQLLGNVTSKNLFTGYGLYHKEETMFAIWQNKKLYLRGQKELATKLVKLGCEAFATDELNKRFVLLNYYALSNEILQNNELLRQLATESIQQIREEKTQRMLKNSLKFKTKMP